MELADPAKLRTKASVGVPPLHHGDAGLHSLGKIAFAFGEIQILGCFSNVAVNPRVCSRGTQGPSLGIDVWERRPVAGHLASLCILLEVFLVFSIVKSRAGLCGLMVTWPSLYILRVLFFSGFCYKESSRSVRFRWLLSKSVHIACSIFLCFLLLRVEPVCASSISYCKRLLRRLTFCSAKPHLFVPGILST